VEASKQHEVKVQGKNHGGKVGADLPARPQNGTRSLPGISKTKINTDLCRTQAGDGEMRGASKAEGMSSNGGRVPQN